MKILFCIPTLEQGGAERQLSYLAAELAHNGHEVHVASARGGANLERLNLDGVQCHLIGGVSNRDPLIFVRLARLIGKLRPDLIQTILTPMDIMGGAAALITGTPWILKESSSAPLYAQGWRFKVRSALGRRADGIVSNSAGGDAYWRSVRGARPLRVIPNAVPLEEIEAASSASKPEVPLQSNEKLILYAGRLDSSKNVGNLIIALALIANEISFTAVICGDGPCRSQLEHLARELDVADRVVFTGHVSNVWTLMKQADALTSLSRFEGCPNVVIEAMAAGCPLVVSDIPAHREILDERTAAFVSPDEPAEIANAIKETLTEGVTARRYAAAAQARVAEWTIERTTRLYECLYLDILSRDSQAQVHWPRHDRPHPIRKLPVE